jgi:hypothetical protein
MGGDMRPENLFTRFRYWLIIFLAGNMPVVLNMVVARPAGFTGVIAYFPHPTSGGIFSDNVLLHEEREYILAPKRDVGWENQSGGEA